MSNAWTVVIVVVVVAILLIGAGLILRAVLVRRSRTDRSAD